MLVPETSRDSRPALVHEATSHSEEGLGGQSQHPGEESGQTGHDPGHSLAAEAEAGQGQDAGCQKTTLVGHGNLPVCGKPEVRGGIAKIQLESPKEDKKRQGVTMELLKLKNSFFCPVTA